MQTKQIIEILGKYFETPKKSGQNLEDNELTVIFEHLTQHNQVSGLDVIYSDAAPAEKPQQAQAAQPSKQQAPQARQPQQQGKPQPQGGQRKEGAPQQP